MKSLFGSLPDEVFATAEERERAVARWEHELRPGLSPENYRSGWVPPDVVQERALARLAELTRPDEPVAVGEALRKVIATWRDPQHLALESLTHTVEIEITPDRRRA